MMPLYIFLCHNCGHEFEERGGFEHINAICPKCGGFSKRKIGNLSCVRWEGGSPSGSLGD